ncbi:hypothetical protein LSM04_008713 [Trypanosoma melophagium]|uniref:uncharacterized protein n=1 Tax=Trypanosoma melophagium TaxID=715481 RepID=UPI00351A60AB|nr:hypothetical protein LSM04_008713 [Trypanosoma melophagium]
MSAAMHLEPFDTEPLLPKCERMAEAMNELRSSEQRYRALVGEEAESDNPREGTTEPSTRAQCLRGIEAALATLGATDSDEPAAAAILRAAEDAKAREEALQTQLAEAAERASGLETMVAEHAEREERLEVQLAEAAERASGLETMVAEHAEREERLEVQLAEAAEREGALEAQLTELVNAVVILQNALEGSAPVASSDEDAKTSGCCAVEALQRLKDCADAASTVMSAAMHLEPFDTEPLLPKCERMAEAMNELRSSEQRYRALVGEEAESDNPREGTTEPSTRAQCLRGIEAALATLGATDSDEPAAAAILRAAEDAKAREEALQTQLAEAAERASGLETMVAEHAEREERLEVQLAEAAERASGLETMVAEHAEREERLEVQLAEAAEREGALEAQLTELVNAVVILQNALEGSAPVASSDEDAKTSGCCAVEALQRLKDCADAASTVMSAAMHLEPFDTEPLLPKCERMAEAMNDLRASEHKKNVLLKRCMNDFSLLKLAVDEVEERIELFLDVWVFPSTVVKELRNVFSSVLGICSLLNCDGDSVFASIEDVLASRDYFKKLCGAEATTVSSEFEDVTRAECVHVMKRAVMRLAPELLSNATLRLPEMLQRGVQEVVNERDNLKESVEELSDFNERLKRDLKVLMNSVDSSLKFLRSDGTDAVSSVSKMSVSFLSRSLVSCAEDIAGRYGDLCALCKECSNVLSQTRKFDSVVSSLDHSLDSRCGESTCELLLVDHCKELVSELLALRAGRRTGYAVMERNAADIDLLKDAVRSAVETLSAAFDDATSTVLISSLRSSSPSSVPLDDITASSLCSQLESCVHGAAKQLRERDRVAGVCAKLLRDVLTPTSLDERGGEALLFIVREAAHELETSRVEIDGLLRSIEQSKRQMEELQRCHEVEESNSQNTLATQAQTHDAMEKQLKEVTERQVAATANAAKLLRMLSEFSGSVAAITLHDSSEEGKSGGAILTSELTGEKENAIIGGVNENTSKKRLDGILEHCSDVMREFEAVKSKTKLLVSEVEDLRRKLREGEDNARELEHQIRNAEEKAAVLTNEMAEEMEFLHKTLMTREVECEKLQLQMQAQERRMDIMRAEMAEAAKSHGSERDNLSKVSSSLLSSNEEMQRRLEEVREELSSKSKEIQKFLHDTQVVSLREGTSKMRGLTTELVLNALILEERERRLRLYEDWIISYPSQPALLLGVCSHIATILSESVLEHLPMRVAQLQMDERDCMKRLGVPAKTAGPTRAAAIKMLQEWAETLGVESAIDSERFLPEMHDVIHALIAGYTPLKKKITLLQNELDSAKLTLESGREQSTQMTNLLRRVHPSDEYIASSTSSILTQPPPTSSSSTETEVGVSDVTLPTSLVALRSECEWASEKLLGNAEQTRKALEVLKPIYNGRSVVEACVRTVEEIQERRAKEFSLLDELNKERANLESCRRSIEASMRVLPAINTNNNTNSNNTTNTTNDESDGLVPRCIAITAELQRLTDILRNIEKRVEQEGYNNHDDDVYANVNSILSELRRKGDQVKLLEADGEHAQQKIQQLESTVQVADVEMQETLNRHKETLQDVQERAKEKQEKLNAQIEEFTQENGKLRTWIGSCASIIGCSDESGWDEACGEHTLEVLRDLVHSRQSLQMDVENLNGQLISARAACATAEGLRLLAQENERRLIDEEQQLSSELVISEAEREKCQASLLQLVETVETVLPHLYPKEVADIIKSTVPSPPVITIADEMEIVLPPSSLELRSSSAGRRLINVSEAAGLHLQSLMKEMKTIKESNAEQLRQLEIASKRLKAAIQDPEHAMLDNIVELSEAVGEELQEALNRIKRLENETEALQCKNDLEIESRENTEKELQKVNLTVDDLETKNSELQEELCVLQSFMNTLAEDMGEAVPHDLNAINKLKQKCTDAKKSALQKSEELERLREEIDILNGGSAALEQAHQNNTEELEKLKQQLLQVQQERDNLLKASEELVDRVQSVLDDHVDVQRELFFANDEDVTVGDIVQLCVERLEQNRVEMKKNNEYLRQLQSENSAMMNDLERCKRLLEAKTEEIAVLHEQLRLAAEGKQTTESEQSRKSAEVESLSRQLQSLFADAIQIAKNEMQLELPLFTDTSVTGALQGLRSLLDYIAEKFRNDIIPDDEVESLKRRLQEQERQYTKESKILYRAFHDHIIPYTEDTNEDSNEIMDSKGNTIRRLTPQHFVAAAESLYHTHSDVRHAIKLLSRLTSTELPLQLQKVSLPQLSTSLAGVTSVIAEGVDVMQDAIRKVSSAAVVQPVEFLSHHRGDANNNNNNNVQEWVRNMLHVLEQSRRRQEDTDSLLDVLTALVRSHGGVVEDTLLDSMNTTNTNMNNTNTNTNNNNMVLSGSLHDLNSSLHDTPSLTSRPRAVYDGVQELLMRLDTRSRALTSEWQALLDQNNRLQQECRRSAAEQEEVQQHVQELRSVVRRKIEEDRRVESSLQELDRHLDMQARELALKYRADHDAIVRQFTDLRGAILRTLKPSRSRSAASTALTSLYPGY